MENGGGGGGGVTYQSGAIRLKWLYRIRSCFSLAICSPALLTLPGCLTNARMHSSKACRVAAPNPGPTWEAGCTHTENEATPARAISPPLAATEAFGCQKSIQWYGRLLNRAASLQIVLGGRLMKERRSSARSLRLLAPTFHSWTEKWLQCNWPRPAFFF